MRPGIENHLLIIRVEANPERPGDRRSLIPRDLIFQNPHRADRAILQQPPRGSDYQGLLAPMTPRRIVHAAERRQAIQGFEQVQPDPQVGQCLLRHSLVLPVLERMFANEVSGNGELVVLDFFHGVKVRLKVDAVQFAQIGRDEMPVQKVNHDERSVCRSRVFDLGDFGQGAQQNH